MKKILSVAVASAVLAGTAFAAADSTVSPSGLGNYLVTPSYFTKGFETKFSVINPSSTNSIVAKVVIRDNACSKEMRDFLIYLTPGDKFDAKIYSTGEGETFESFVTTTDDSVASASSFPEKLYDPTNTNTNGVIVPKYSSSGYVEVFTLAEFDSSIYKDFAEKTAMKKSELIDAYKKVEDGNTTYIGKLVDDCGGSNAPLKCVTPELMTGTFSLVNTTSGKERGMSARLTAVALQQLKNGITGQYRQNTVYDQVLTDANGSAAAAKANVLQQLFDSLKVKNIAVPYEKGQPSLLNVAFIGKHLGAIDGVQVTTDNKKDYSCEQPIEYQALIRNNKEETIQAAENIFSQPTKTDPSDTIKTELGFVNIPVLLKKNADKFTEGWINFKIDQSSKFTSGFKYIGAGLYDNTVKSGVPLVPSLMNGIKVGDKTVTNLFIPASK